MQTKIKSIFRPFYLKRIPMKSLRPSIISSIFMCVILGNQLFVSEASAQLDGVEGTVVMSSETVRANITGDTPITYPVFTSYSDMFGQYYLADHRSFSELHVYDATGYNDPGAAGAFFSTCVEPMCYAVSQSSNAWLTGDAAYHASDFRNAKKVLDFFYNYYGRNGADNNGENLIILSGVNYNDATAMGIFRCIALGKPDYAMGKPSFGTIGIMAHEFTHIMSWHEWVGVWDYGIEGSMRGVKGTVDEHLANLFGVIASYYVADEPWVSNIRWAYEAEHNYGENYTHRNDSDFYNTMNISRNPYLGTDSGESRAYVSQLYSGGQDAGGIHKNAVLLDRAAYLFTEGGFAAQAPNGVPLANWPMNAPDFEVKAIGMDRLMQIAYNVIVTDSYVTPVGTIGLSDLGEIEQDSAAMKAELTRYAYIVLAASEQLTKDYGWPAWVPISVRNGFAAVGLLEARDYNGVLALYPTNGNLWLKQNYPNPFNPSTLISYYLPNQSHVTLKVHDVLGREVATLVDGMEEPGLKTVTFDASKLSNGVYYYRLQAGNYVETKKLVLLR
jgi:hypothetical protein